MKRIVAALLICTSVVFAQDGGVAERCVLSAIRTTILNRLDALLKGGSRPEHQRRARRRDAAHVCGRGPDQPAR